MRNKSFAEMLKSSQLLVKALKERGDELPVGITMEVVNKLEISIEKAFNANAQQEKLKALLKEKTSEMETYLNDIKDNYSFIKKYLKLGVQQELWREFGIEDKR